MADTVDGLRRATIDLDGTSLPDDAAPIGVSCKVVRTIADEIERLRADAARYQYLRAGMGSLYITTGDVNDGTPSGLAETVADAAIDKALSGIRTEESR